MCLLSLHIINNSIVILIEWFIIHMINLRGHSERVHRCFLSVHSRP